MRKVPGLAQAPFVSWSPGLKFTEPSPWDQRSVARGLPSALASFSILLVGPTWICMMYLRTFTATPSISKCRVFHGEQGFSSDAVFFKCDLGNYGYLSPWRTPKISLRSAVQTVTRVEGGFGSPDLGSTPNSRMIPPNDGSKGSLGYLLMNVWGDEKVALFNRD